MTATALTSLGAAAVALVIQTVAPFDHGVWLIAYLLLVGFLAQLLLAIGQATLLSAGALSTPPRRVRVAQTLLWNVGVAVVPLGVLAEIRVAVVSGSLSLIAALASLATSVRFPLATALAHRCRLGWGYASLLAAMAISTAIGTALAWDIPWT